MKKMILIFIAFAFACTQPKPTPKLSGKYVVGGFHVENNMDTNGGRLVSVLEGSNYAFDFLTDSTLQIDSKLGLTYFSDSIFQYKIEGKTLVLTGDKVKHVIPFKQDHDILNLYIHKNGIDTLQIMPAKK